MENFPVEMQNAWKTAREAVEKAQAAMKKQHDKRATEPMEDYNIGDKVYLFQPNPKKGLSPKLQRCYKGPSRVVELSAANARIVPVETPRAKPQLVHINRLKKAKYQGPSEMQSPNRLDQQEQQDQPGTSGAEHPDEEINLTFL